MQGIRNLFLAIAGAAFTIMALVFTASIGLALVGIFSVLMIAGAVSARLAPRPARADARRNAGAQREPRIWNDGRGTIIDL